MDKNEYNLKLQEIDQYVDHENFEEAAKVADSIEWKRVRNVRTLCMVSEIYEAVDRYEDSKELLLKAYRKSPVGRAILYRLVEVTIQLKQFDEAIEYYSEYVQAAPHDNNRFILKYKIYRGRGSSVEEQIDILKEYLDQEYSEKYAYELAKLYQQADRIPDMLAACDDLVLWFHSGKYVIKALELKKKYAPLTPKQQQIYDHRFDAENVEDFDILPGQEQFSAQNPVVETADPMLAETIAEDTQKSIAAEVAAAAAETAAVAEETPVAAAEESAEKTRILGKEMLEQATEAARALAAEASVAKTQILGKEMLAQSETDAAETANEETDAEKLAEDASADAAEVNATEAAPTAEEAEVSADAAETAAETVAEAADTIAEEVTEAAPAVEAVVPQVELPKYNTQELQTEVIKNMRQIVSGIGRVDEIDEDQAAMDELIDQSKQDQVDAKESQVRLQKTLNLPKVPQTRATAPQLSIDDILLSMGERGEAVREAAAKAVKPTRPTPAGVLSAVDEALLNLGIQPETPVAEEIEEETTPEMTETTEPVIEEVAPAAQTTENELKEDMSKELAEAFAEEPEQAPAAAELSEEEILTAKTRIIPTEEIADRYEKESMQKLQEEIAQVMSETEEAEQVEETIEETEAEAEAEVPAAEEAQDAPAEEIAEEDYLDEEEPIDAEQLEATAAREVRQIEEPDVEDNMAYAPKADTAGLKLRPEVRSRFAEFLDIEGLEGQIENALEQALAKGKDRTSRTGNVLIFGGHGCGKTTIAKALARSLAQIRGIKTLKMAQIYATDLNRKDIAATISKIAGGVLIVEEAGDLEDKVVDQLTTAMEFRTDGLILILEDEQKYIHDLLMRHPRFTMKFTSQISIPNFTPDELVSFAEHYAESKSSVLADSAADMLGAKLAEQMDQGTAVSLTNVIELVDKAIHKANTFGRKLLAGKKRFDEMNRVILIDKDFK